MTDGACVIAGGATSVADRTYINDNNKDIFAASKKVRFARMCCYISGGTNQQIKLGTYLSNSTNYFSLYKSLKSGNPVLYVDDGNNIFHSDRNWFDISIDTYYPGIYLDSTATPYICVDTSGYDGYWEKDGELTEGGSYENFGSKSWSTGRLHIGTLIIDCSVTGNSGGYVIPITETHAYYGNIEYQTWDGGYSQAYLNIFAPWEIDGVGWSGYVTTGTYAYTTTTTIGSTLYTYRAYIVGQNSSDVNVIEYLYVQELGASANIYVNSSTGSDYNAGDSCTSGHPVHTFSKAYALLSSGGTIHVCNSGADFSSESVTLNKSFSIDLNGSDGYFYGPQGA